MNSHFKLFLLLILAITFYTNILSQSERIQENKSHVYVKSNLEFLSDDLLEGRELASKGEKIAALYISEELEKYGVLPFGDNGTYYQDFGVITAQFGEKSNVSFIIDKKEITYANASDFVYSLKSQPSNFYNGKEFEMIYVGYGINSEIDNYNSYKDIDVKNKVVMVNSGTPKLEGREFLSKSAVKKFKRNSAEKIKLAKEYGAAGIILLPNKYTINYWESIVNWAKNGTFNLVEEADTNKIGKDIPAISLNNNLASLLLKNEKNDFNSILTSLDPDPESFLLKSKIKFNYDLIVKEKVGRNILGLIKGINPNLKSEYLTMGAHYDHEGIKNGNVYNGADDNGSGTVTLLETARRFAASKQNERPIVIIFHTGEEKGLKGSKYLTNHSKFLDSAIVHVNVDMVGRKSEDSIYCIGASKISSELGQLIEEVNSETTNFFLDYKFDEPFDPQRLYYRSDHINYAKKGIPIAFFYDYMKADYHKPSDTVDKINFDKIVRMTDLIYNLFLKISNLDHKLSVDAFSTN